MAEADALGTLIRSSRLNKGLSRGQLASSVGRSQSTVRRWERGESVPAADVVDDLAAALGLNADEFRVIVASAHREQSLGGQVDTDETGTGELATPDDDATAKKNPETPATTPRAHTTIEDDDVLVEVTPYFETPGPVAPPPPVRQPSTYGRMSSAVWGRRDSWIGWVRGFLTLLALLFLFMGFIWAIGELLSALQEVSGSFSTGG
jgi:transcriptional regulator with XRE-family HTH domain